ncbi:MAG: hypothetical protein H6981_03775 [Gammaproteobacteria bacterium]|nr:hypothetical protein [Gammaproteobacteria bacterium]MCP5135906.1 hypothetical protein [Gammaproteobacteria bacterium]
MHQSALPTNRSFGLLFTIVFCVLAIWRYMRHDAWSPYLLIAIALVFLALGLANSNLLTPLNRLWMRFGELLGMIVSPIVLGVIYFILIAPIGIGMRLFGRDPMNRTMEPNAQTYWEYREEPTLPADSFNNQF